MAVNKLCRLCSSPETVNNAIFDEESKLYMKMALYLPIKILQNDRLPQKICNLCCNKINEFDTFCKTAIEVQIRLETDILNNTNNVNTSVHTEKDENSNKNVKECDNKEALSEFRANEIVYVKNELDEKDLKYSGTSEDEVLKPDNKNEGKRHTLNSNSEIEQICQKDMLICGYPPPETLPASKETPVHTDKLKKYPHVCNVCKKVFKRSSTLIRHQRLHNFGRQYECRECGKRFALIYRLDRHKETVHSGKKPYVCSTCNKSFSARSNLHRHEKIHAGDRPFKCDICKKAYIDSYKLHCHKQIVHLGERRFACSLCDKAFGQRRHLTDHHKTHFNIRPFQCSECGKSFSMRFNLKRHLKMHAESKQYACSFCDATYRKQSKLILHERSHTGEQPYECDECGASMVSKDEIKVHIWKHMGHNPVPCKICGKSSISLSELKKHELVHTQEKPHVCAVCDRSFKRKGNLNRHKRIHEAEDRPYDCIACGKCYKDASYLRRHLREVHEHQEPTCISETQASDTITLINGAFVKLEPIDI